MYRDYFNDVLAYYRAGQKSASLPQRLMRPTPASIRDECLAACQARFHTKDFRALTAFFKVDSDKDKMIRAIRKCELSRFKPLVYLLTGRIINTDDLNIELLAWLIDFPDRPFKLGGYQKSSADADDEIVNEVTVEEDLITIGEGEIKAPAKQYIKWINHPTKSKTILLGILLFLVAGFYITTSKSALFATDNKLSQKDILAAENSYLPIKISSKSLINPASAPYSRCTGASPCKACSNCKYCNWCNSGGTCSICTPSSKKTVTQKRASQCQAITKKGTQCSRAAKSGSDYCWQHGR